MHRWTLALVALTLLLPAHAALPGVDTGSQVLGLIAQGDNHTERSNVALYGGCAQTVTPMRVTLTVLQGDAADELRLTVPADVPGGFISGIARVGEPLVLDATMPDSCPRYVVGGSKVFSAAAYELRFDRS